MRVLLLGGTAEARALAALLVERGVEVTSCLAGRVSNPRLPVGEVRIGGFGGVDGLAAELKAYDVLVDATHPYAARISAHAAQAADRGGRLLVRLERPGWEPREGWVLVDDHDAAAQAAASLGGRPVLTVGRQELHRYLGPLAGHEVLARVVEDPDEELPERWRLVRDRGPYQLDGELALLRDHGADVLVTKDSGGVYTRPKLDAAEALGIPVVVVRRPGPPPGVQVVTAPEQALEWVLGHAG